MGAKMFNYRILFENKKKVAMTCDLWFYYAVC